MKANYHTHTYRCHHAYGCEWEYVENAIEGGMKILGFADHAPMPFPNGYRSRVRMTPDKLCGYIETVQKLQTLYGDRIELHCGLEAEYYPELFPAFLEMLKETPGVEYLILGQHFLENEYEKRIYSTKETTDEKLLAQYTDQVIAGMETGKFLYICHPDVLNFQGDKKIYRRHAQRLCRAANALGIPLELNLQGFRAGFRYPRTDFWAVAGEENCTAVIGTDAHMADRTCNHEEIKQITAFAEKFGLRIKEQLEINKELLK